MDSKVWKKDRSLRFAARTAGQLLPLNPLFFLPYFLHRCFPLDDGNTTVLVYNPTKRAQNTERTSSDFGDTYAYLTSVIINPVIPDRGGVRLRLSHGATHSTIKKISHKMSVPRVLASAARTSIHTYDLFFHVSPLCRRPPRFTSSASNENRTTNTQSKEAIPARANPLIDRILRVDHAGELGADRIYAGQMAVLGRSSVAPIIQHMWDQEKHHLATFEKLLPKYRARPTALLPLWHAAGFMLGAGTALLGKRAAMACTVAVEESIGEHYNNQIRDLVERYPDGEYEEILRTIKQFRDEELEHLETGLDNEAELTPAYQALKAAIQLGCKVAIFAAERV